MIPRITRECANKIFNAQKDKAKVMVINVGSASTQVLIYDHKHEIISSQSRQIELLTPEKNSSEIDPLKLWNDVVELCHSCFKQSSLSASDITCMGDPVINISTRKDTRAAGTCDYLNSLIEFKIYCMLTNGDALFGTLDSWIAFNLSEKKYHITDYASVSYTGLCDPVHFCYNKNIISFLKLKSDCFPKIISPLGFLFETGKNIFGSSILVTSMTRTDLPNMKILKEKIQKGIDYVAIFKKIASTNENQEDCKYINEEKTIDLLNEIIFKFYRTWTNLASTTCYDNYVDLGYISIDDSYCSSDYLLQGISSMIDKNVTRLIERDASSKGAYITARLGACLNKEDNDFVHLSEKGKNFEPDHIMAEYLHKILEKRKKVKSTPDRLFAFCVV
ncbi:hypothetical protein HZS_265 [Henneguya salminicola]|nr:hypothetical protein HZS_265 [Henneguya salminicola]